MQTASHEPMLRRQAANASSRATVIVMIPINVFTNENIVRIGN
jgi:hypothetical protein